MRLRLRILAVLNALVCVASTVALASPSAAADCSGALQAQMIFGAASRAYVPAPEGLDYASQPAANLTVGEVVFGIVRAARDDGCPVPGASASIASRDAGTPEFVTRRTATTNANGYVEFRVLPPRTTYLRSRVTVGDEKAQTAPVLRTVRPAVRTQFTSPGACVMLAEGGTYPAKPRHPVWLQRRITQNGAESGYATVSRGVTDAGGKFRVAYKAPCGADFALAAYIPASATNTAGRSLFVDLHVKADR
jgi:hypothetical protein